MEFTSPVNLAYLLVLTLLGLYGLHRLSMIWHFRSGFEPEKDPLPETEWPVVTVQLPLFNERNVAARLIRSIGALDYPADRLEIQVLDDSDDETCAVADHEVQRLREAGLDAHVLRRNDRKGFKAGALDLGMAQARGELLAIFDADFLPGPDFLKRLAPRFTDPRTGMVQARWEHMNREESTLTRAQSVLLDGHFVIEHTVRHQRGLFFNFNGTAGIWRRAAIEEAGGWQHDTLTEDLDLSYRSQLQGWRFEYMPTIPVPAELPHSIAAFKSQQHRWAKGSVQVAKKLGAALLRAEVPLRIKLEAFVHLSSNIGYPLVLCLAILLPLSVGEGPDLGSWWYLSTFLLCVVSVILFYDRSQSALGRHALARFRDISTAMSLGIGMCVSQTCAIVEGFFQETGEFVRTPKSGDAVRNGQSYSSLKQGLPGIELLFAAWFVWGLINAIQLGQWGALPFLALFFWSFAWVGILSVRDRLRLPSKPSICLPLPYESHSG